MAIGRLANAPVYVPKTVLVKCLREQQGELTFVDTCLAGLLVEKQKH